MGKASSVCAVREASPRRLLCVLPYKKALPLQLTVRLAVQARMSVRASTTQNGGLSNVLVCLHITCRMAAMERRWWHTWQML